ncbi:MBL fold metallo-hydrolase [Paenibacillus sp. y28]|uniref:MBL fold metallo-hydrolase n=1 Tax=Paenibacillus sp. y28 TaxID=3129110 RepID=UPI00301795F2
MNRIHEVTATITQVKVPLPFPLRWVNSYVIREGDGITVIDPGLHTPDSVAVWQEAMAGLGFGFRDVQQIVLTHHHPDHYGLAGWLQAESGAPVYLSEQGIRQAALLWSDQRTMTDGLHALFLQHGMDAETGKQLQENMESFVPMVSPQPDLLTLPEEGTIRLGAAEYRILHTPGHALGHLCFLDERAGRIFCGDHVLPSISPNVSLMPGLEVNPLASFLESLQEVSALRVTEALPGHRDPFAQFSERALELIRHHEERLALMRSRLSVPMTAYALCRDIFGHRLTLHQLRFAMAETLAHVVYLESEGLITASEQDGQFVYRS